MNNIEETLKKIAAGTSRESSPTSSTINSARLGLPGDPDCPICGGVGYLRKDVPITHPDFGKIVICSCREGQVAQAIHQRLFSFSNLETLKHMTFETFKPQGRGMLRQEQVVSLEGALSTSARYARELNGWLVLQGTYGCGKTHLAASIANFAVNLGVPTLFITVPDLLDWLRFSFSSDETSFEQRFEEIRTIRLLVLDDFGTQNATPWAQEKLFQILNYRYVNQLPLVLTTNQKEAEIEPRIRSRLQDRTMVHFFLIDAPDYRRDSSDEGGNQLSSLGLHAKQTFDNFSLRKNENFPQVHQANLEKALQLALDFAKNPQGWLVLTGTYGCGKTHLAAAIANYQTTLGHPVLFVNLPDLLDHLRATFNPNSMVSYDERFEEIKSAPLLVLDELETQSSTPWAHEKLFQLINQRYYAELPTVITSADAANELHPRLQSRIFDTRLCHVFAITAPSYYGGMSGAAIKTHRGRRSPR